MSRHEREQLAMIHDLVAAAGGRLVSIWHGRHLRVEIKIEGKRAVLTVAGSPSDHNSGKNARAQTQRVIRALQTGVMA